MRVVMKFGGGLLTSGREVKNCARLVKERVDAGDQVIVVVSALSGVTDRLIEAMDLVEGGNRGEMEKFSQEVHSIHVSALDACGTANGDDITLLIDSLIGRLREYLESYRDGDRSPGKRDEIQSMGERLCAPIFSHYLTAEGVEAVSLTGGEAGIVTDSCFGNAIPEMDSCRRLVVESLGSLLGRGVTPVVTGFLAQNEEGEVTTLGRGGSDYTTSLIGACIGADEIWIWKDVCGIMTANPKVVPGARTIPMLSYTEAAELAHFGARVLHPRTMEPAMGAMIPIRVRDATRPDLDGTLISQNSMEIGGSVKAVTSIDRVGLISISGTGMAGIPGVAARVFDSIARGGANVMMISQSSSETNITIIVPKRDLEVCRDQLDMEFRDCGTVRKISLDEGVSVVSVVGSGMKGTPGVAARVFRAVADAGVNVVMIAQGSSEVNISFVVGQADSVRAVTSIHREFRLDELF